MLDHLTNTVINCLNSKASDVSTPTIIAFMAVLFLPTLINIVIGALLRNKYFFGHKKCIISLCAGITTVGFLPILLLSYLLLTSHSNAVYTNSGINVVWVMLAISIGFSLLTFPIFCRPYLSKAWYGGKSPFTKRTMPEDGSGHASVYSRALLIKLWGSTVLLAALCSLGGLGISHYIYNTSLHTVVLVLPSVFVVLYFLHSFVVQYLLKCDHCHRNVLDFSQQHYKYGGWSRQLKTILFSNSFHCVCCGAYYALSTRTLKKHQQLKESSSIDLK